MKKIITFLIILIALFLGCKKVDNKTGITPITTIKKNKISGVVQKGPYINGTQIIMYVLDDKLAQAGKVFNTQIKDNKGSFELTNVELSSKYIQLVANGYYFNEALNSITIAPLELNALTDITDASTVNVNILTHLEKRRVEFLVKSGKTFTEAKKTAQKEIQAIFGIQISQSTVSEKLDIVTAGDANAILLAISLIIQGEQSVGDMSEILATISADLEDDGLMTNTTAMTKLIKNAKSLKLDSIRQNLLNRYQELGVTATIPDFEKYIKVFLFEIAQKPSAESKSLTRLLNHRVTLNGLVNPNGAETTVTFEYGVTSNYGKSILANGSPLYGDTASSVSADIINLDSLTKYHYRIKAENGKGITYSADSTFTTLKDEPDLVTGLVANYAFNGNANDESGNGNNGTVNGATLTTDRFGIVDKAYLFNGIDNDISVPFSNSLNSIQNQFTITAWVFMDGGGGAGGCCPVLLNLNSQNIGGINFRTQSTSNTSRAFYAVFYNEPITNPRAIDVFSNVGLSGLEWHHVACVADAAKGNAKLFFDGVFVAENNSTQTFNSINYDGTDLIIGNRNGKNWWGGKLDDIRIYNRVLSEAEIAYLATH